MTPDDARLVETIARKLHGLSAGELITINKIVGSLHLPCRTIRHPDSDLVDEAIAGGLGVYLRIHHSISEEPFTKDKFEYAMKSVFDSLGKKAKKPNRTNPGYDLEIDGVKFSLKSQADKGIKDDEIWISKFMEMGRGVWGNDPDDLIGLRERFFEHLQQYDRIISLRLLKSPPAKCRYELVEISKDLLRRSASGRLEMKLDSRQTPKPGYCYVTDDDGSLLFSLYFDGGSERKLQIKNLKKSQCLVHCVWEFDIPLEVSENGDGST